MVFGAHPRACCCKYVGLDRQLLIVLKSQDSQDVMRPGVKHLNGSPKCGSILQRWPEQPHHENGFRMSRALYTAFPAPLPSAHLRRMTESRRRSWFKTICFTCSSGTYMQRALDMFWLSTLGS